MMDQSVSHFITTSFCRKEDYTYTWWIREIVFYFTQQNNMCKKVNNETIKDINLIKLNLRSNTYILV